MRARPIDGARPDPTVVPRLTVRGRRGGRLCPAPPPLILSFMEIGATLDAWRAALEAGASPARAAMEKRYLRSPLAFLGATVPQARGIARRFARAYVHIKGPQMQAVAEAAFARGVHELRSVAIFTLVLHADALDPIDLPWIERLVREAGTWAHVDELAVNVVGDIVERNPQEAPLLERWSRDPDFWLRRAALLALLGPLRRGLGDFALFERLATPLLADPEPFVRKAIGWVLREVAKLRPELTIGFLERHDGELSGVTLREATRRLPPGTRARFAPAAGRRPARKAPPRPSRRTAKPAPAAPFEPPQKRSGRPST